MKTEKDNFAGISVEDIDFFGEKGEGFEIEDKKIEEQEADTKEEVSTTEEKKKNIKEEKEESDGILTEDADFFPEEYEEENNTEDKVEDKVENQLIEKFKKKGYISEEFDTEVTDEEDLIDIVVEEAAFKLLDSELKKLPPELKSLNKFVLNGGSITEFISELSSKTEFNVDNIDLTDEKDLEKIVKYKFKKADLDDETIEAQIKILKEKGKLEELGEKEYEKLKKEKEEFLKNKEEQIQKNKRDERLSAIKTKRELTEKLQKMEDIKGLQLTTKDKIELPKYVTEKSVEVNGNKITPMMRDIMLAVQDPDKTLILAKLLKDDFDFSTIKKKAESSKVEEIEKKLNNKKRTNKNKKSSIMDAIFDLSRD